MSALDILKNIFLTESLGDFNESLIEFVGKGDPLINTPFRMADTLAAVAAAKGIFIARLWKDKTGRQQSVKIDMTEAGVNLTSFMHQRQNGFKINFPDPVYPTVGFYKCKDDRWVFLNGGYPHLRNSILKVLESPNEADYIERAVSKWNSFELENAIMLAGGCGDVLRTEKEWLENPQGSFLKKFPVIQINKIADGPKKFLPTEGDRPLSGVRVLDLTHVIAGPTCSRSFAEHGADVLHITGPHLPSIFPFVIDTGHGKRNAHLDLREEGEREILRELIKTADIFVQGYEPGKIASFGFSAEEVAKINPGIVYVSLSCFGDDGPWGHRAGFEQLGQTVSGMAAEYSQNLEKPSLVPAFPCDYITGYLGALGGLMSLKRREDEGGSYHVHISLTRTAMFVMEQERCNPSPDVPTWPEQSTVDPYLIESVGPYGRIRHLRPMVQMSETPTRWDLPPSPFGSGEAKWAD